MCSFAITYLSRVGLLHLFSFDPYLLNSSNVSPIVLWYIASSLIKAKKEKCLQ